MAQIDKNTVPAQGQLDKKCVFLYPTAGAKKKILFVGNSITLHGAKPELGWDHASGMAASAAENDYVHTVVRMLRESGCPVSYGICQVADWERADSADRAILSRYREARDFQADILVMRWCENCPWQNFDAALFEEKYRELIRFFDPEHKAVTVFTTSFWKHPADEVIALIGAETDCGCVYLGDLGEQDRMKAIGKFENPGVANHPGDLGMKTIAERIFDAIVKKT